MDRASSTSSSGQLASTPTTQSSSSASSAHYAGGQGGGAKPPPFPQFNLPDSYWSQPRDKFFDAQLSPDVMAIVVQHLAKSDEGVVTFKNALARLDEDKENDPRSRTESWVLQRNLAPLHAVDFDLSKVALSEFLVLKDPDDGELQPQFSTSSTISNAATAVQQDTAASGCCIPPSCTIL